MLVRHLLDVHAAFGGGDEGDAAGGAVDQRRQIQLARDGRAVLDIEPPHHAALRPGLVGDQRHAQHALGFLLHIVDGLDHLDAAALAAAAGMDLRLHHPDRAAQFLGRRHRFLDREGGLAARHRHAEAAQDLFGLIFVDVHGKTPEKAEIWLESGGTIAGDLAVQDAISPRWTGWFSSRRWLQKAGLCAGQPVRLPARYGPVTGANPAEPAGGRPEENMRFPALGTASALFPAMATVPFRMGSTGRAKG